MAFPAPHDTYPGKDDVADFLQAYAAKFDLPVVLNTKVTSLRHNELYEVRTNQGPISAHNVVVATGPFQCPFIPPLATELDAGVFQIHSIEYRRPDSIPPGKVLVVGAANTGEPAENRRWKRRLRRRFDLINVISRISSTTMES